QPRGIRQKIMVASEGAWLLVINREWLSRSRIDHGYRRICGRWNSDVNCMYKPSVVPLEQTHSGLHMVSKILFHRDPELIGIRAFQIRVHRGIWPSESAQQCSFFASLKCLIRIMVVPSIKNST